MTQGKQETDDGVNAAVAVGALILGSADGVKNVVANNATLVGKLIEPGDQRRIPHLLDDFKALVSNIRRAMTTPVDMNIKHSVHPLDNAHPIDSALNLHGALVTATANNFTEQGFVEGLRSSSAAAAGVIVGTVDPFKKLKVLGSITDVAADAPKAMEILQAGAGVVKPDSMSWKTYEHLLGHGSQPQKLKPLTDFSSSMDYSPPNLNDMTSRLTYVPDKNHKIVMDLFHEWDDASPTKIKHTVMDFVVRADNNLQEEYGSGPAMFHSALKLIQGNAGVRIDRIDGKWSKEGTLATNYDEFVNARAQGATIKEAARHTPTGRWAGDAGFTDVGGKHFNLAIRSEKLPEDLHPEFTRPVFSADPAYNTYGEKWASSQGRSRQDLVPRQGMEDSPKILSTLEQELAVLPKKQADEVWRCIEEHFAKQTDAAGGNIDPELKR